MSLAGISGVAITLALGASATTYVGGRVALRLGSRMSLVLGLTAGVVLGIALFDLLPEAFEIGRGLLLPRTLFLAVSLGMLIYMAVDWLLAAGRAKGERLRPHLGPASLTLHSLLDGVGIGLAFHVSFGVGMVMAAAVLAHDFADGFNTVGMSLAGNLRDAAHRWLLADAAAPPIGAVIGGMIRLDNSALALALAGFAGAFLYIGTCQLLPRSHAAGNHLWTVTATMCGVFFAFGVAWLARM